MGSKLFRLFILAPIPYWLYLIFSDSIGAEPAKFLNHKTGEISLYFLLLNLFIGIFIALKFRFPQWIRFLLMHRRFLGVVTFIYLIFHLILYLLIEGLELQAFTQMYTKTYLIFASLAWLIILVLTLTSNNFSMKRLGSKRWKKIHKTIYLASALVTVHVLLIEKADLVKYGLLFSLLWIAQSYRYFRFKTKTEHPSGDLK